MTAGSKQGHGSGFRPDIEGMRAIAIVSVLLAHAGVAIFAGGYVGVDVFFVISGYLITRLLLGEFGRDNTISIRRFYARRAKRLLPQSAMLLVFVCVLSLIIFSPVRAIETSGDVISAAFYVANWHFAQQSVNYFAQGNEPSPVLHLWSLAIEEQFYVVWPTVMLLVTWFARRRGAPIKGPLWVALGLIFAASLVYGVILTNEQPAFAYFSTFGRAWELALGGILALLGSVRIPRRAAAGIGWAGLGLILYAIFAFDAETQFPGTAALIPTLGAAALILAGASVYAEARGAPSGVIGVRPIRYIGRISYAWYLWHWPFLIFAAAIWGALSPLAGIAVVLASAVPTILTHHLVEDPARRSRTLARLPNRALALGAGCMAVAVIAAVVLEDAQTTAKTPDSVAGAAALVHQKVPQQRATEIRPSPLNAQTDRSKEFEDGCLVGTEGTTSAECTYGNRDSDHTVILFGDSHAMQYFPALEFIAKKHDWRLIALTKRECTPAQIEVRSEIEQGEYHQCDVWRKNAMKRIEEEGPGVTVVLSSDSKYTPFDPASGKELSGKEAAQHLQDAYQQTLETLLSGGEKPIVIRDNPAAEFDVPSCVSENLDSLEKCAFEWVKKPNREFDVRAAERSKVPIIDVTPEVCPDRLCRAVTGNALVFRDRAHLTATFARTLSPWIEEAMRKANLLEG